MSYRQTFDETIRAVLGPFDRAGERDLWPEHLAEEGVAYGQEQQLTAEEAAAWYLSAAALIRMEDGLLGVPLASRLLRQARKVARARGLSSELQDALARMEEERHQWIAVNHEYQGAALRDLRPVPVDPALPTHFNADFDGVDVSHADDNDTDFGEDFVPPPDWPDLLERLLADRSGAPS